MKAVKLKLGTHMDNGLMYRVNQNHAGPLMKIFCHTFLKKL